MVDVHNDLSDRRERILDAAERSFIQAGFHRTTVQDVARQAGMSPGNLYRYFPSKDAIVTGLVERDRAMLREDFASFAESERLEHFLSALARKHFQDEPRTKALLCLQIWAEATVNGVVAAANALIEQEVISGLARLITAGQGRGEVAAGVDPEATAQLIMTISSGLFVRRALYADFDAAAETGALIDVIRSVLRGDALGVAPTHSSNEHALSAAETSR